MLPKKLATLAAEYNIHEAALRADLQQYYSIDIDRAMRGEHTAHHIACLVMQLPSDARIRTAENEDSMWTLNDVLTACLLNSLNGLIYGMSDKRKRGRKPELVGPSWMKGDTRKRSLPARIMPVSELMQILEMPRG